MSKDPVVISSKGQFDSILKSSKVVLVDFYADWCGPCKQIAPLFASLSNQFSREKVATFVKVNTDNHKDLAKEYNVAALPTFLLFQNGKVVKKVQGANPRELESTLVSFIQALGDDAGASSSGSGDWRGAEVPRGYSDITDQVELRNCEILNADEDSGPVKVLFDTSKPSGLEKGKAAASSKDWVQSGADDQLLLFIPLQSSVKVHTLQFTSLPPADEDDAPSRPEVIQLYINKPQNIDFDEAEELEPTQIIELKDSDWNADGTANVSLRFVKFQKTTTLIVFIQKAANGAETVRLDRVKLVGEAGAKREMGKLQKVGEEE